MKNRRIIAIAYRARRRIILTRDPIAAIRSFTIIVQTEHHVARRSRFYNSRYARAVDLLQFITSSFPCSKQFASVLGESLITGNTVILYIDMAFNGGNFAFSRVIHNVPTYNIRRLYT